jgi:hypothetical protein
MNLISICEERADDAAAVRDLHTAAFGRPVEAGIVDRLRESCPDLASFVAVDGGRVVGHVLFSPVTVDDGPAGMGAGPAGRPARVPAPRDRLGPGRVRPRGPPRAGLPVRPPLRPPRVLPPLRVRAGVGPRPPEPPGGGARRGLHGARARRRRHGRGLGRDPAAGRVRRGHGIRIGTPPVRRTPSARHYRAARVLGRARPRRQPCPVPGPGLCAEGQPDRDGPAAVDRRGPRAISEQSGHGRRHGRVLSAGAGDWVGEHDVEQ